MNGRLQARQMPAGRGGNLFVIRDRRLRRRKSCDGNAER